MKIADRAECELVVVGGGPAGLAAATLAAELNIDTVILDEQEAPGGQIYRAVERRSSYGDRVAPLLGPDFRSGLDLVNAFRHSGAAYAPASAVWQVTPDGAVGITQQGEASLLRSRHVILATGAMERPVPVSGWTLPGVMGAGAAQTLLKSSGIVPSETTVIAGCGPLPLLVAAQLLEAGVPLKAVLITAPRMLPAQALYQLPWALTQLNEIRKGLSWMRRLRAAGVAIYYGVSDVVADGADKLELVSFTAKGKSLSIPASVLLLHDGVVPNVQLSRSAGCRHVWDEAQLTWRPVVDEWGATSQERISIAGDGQRILGAKAAEPLGRLAALDAACRLGRISVKERDARAEEHRKLLKRLMRIRPFLDRAFPPSLVKPLPKGNTIVCRCEEISASFLRETIRDGLTDPNQIKSLTRCGMGPCQGRMCGTTVGRIIAEELGKSVEQVGLYRPRIPVKPVTLGAWATLRNAVEDPAAQHTGEPSRREL
ncbi:NAD(P)/FAD-dependent oxidoreductase [Paraburkholderia phytofirmans]|uniref:FAD/NAD(P)-dependent oxidoreductase n=1 Tax=Paraburkholderia phytofirmans TaxID=261302 RepID=UPI0007B60D6E|nr:NAD(P)/FAD-dependent oxidoreductase [Paraburkholderia phytofirmans]